MAKFLRVRVRALMMSTIIVMRFTTGIAANSSVPIQFQTETDFPVFSFAICKAPLADLMSPLL